MAKAKKRPAKKTVAKKTAAKNTNKTQLTQASVEEYLANIADETRRKDCQALTALLSSAMKEKPRMWGPGIVGFGSYHYRYDSGREGDMCLAGFSSRADSISVYVMLDAPGQKELLPRLGKHKTSSRACVYIKRLSDIDLTVLKSIVLNSVAEMKRLHP
jgi:hypothetical protein